MKQNSVFYSTLAVLGILTLLELGRRTGTARFRRLMSRRGALKVAGLSLIALVAESWQDRLKALASGYSVTQAPHCVLSPEMTAGPYYIPREKVRRNITEHKPGVPLQLRLSVVDAATCTPIKGAAVDIWHCDAGGLYSGFISASTRGGPGGGSGPTDKHTFLRGIQMTNSRGLAIFQTIYPGWYRGRTVHIHVTVHIGGTVGHIVHTGQLFFSDSLTKKVYGTGAYKARSAERDTFNATDSIYANGGAQATLTMKHDGHGGYTGTITLGVRRS